MAQSVPGPADLVDRVRTFVIWDAKETGYDMEIDTYRITSAMSNAFVGDALTRLDGNDPLKVLSTAFQ